MIQSFALLFLDKRLRHQLSTTTCPILRRAFARAGLANLTAWFGWLRGTEMFSIRWCDVDLTPPGSGSRHDLPDPVGVVEMRLLEATKSARSKTADMVLVYKSNSGLSLGFWVTTLAAELQLEPRDWPSRTALVFVHETGRAWSSRFFRETYLIPSLHEQREAGDPYLLAFDRTPGNNLIDTFYA